MKVLFHTDGADIGGNETAIFHIAQALREEGHRVGLTGREGAASRFLRPAMDDWISSPPFRDWQPILENYRPDVCVMVQGDIFSLSTAARRRGIPAIWMYGHPLLPQDSDLGRSALGLFQTIIAQSSFLARRLEIVTGEAAAQVRVIPNGIDCERFTPPSMERRWQARQKLGLGWDEFIIGFGARWAEYKRHLDLIQAFRLLKEKVPEARLLLWGRADGASSEKVWKSLKPHLEAEADSIFTIGSTPEDVPFWLSALDVFAFPAVGEGLGSALLEAMAMEVPVVVVRSGGLVEPFRYGACGIRVPHSDTRSLSSALYRLAKAPLVRRTLGKVGRDIVQAHYSSDQMARRYVGIFERAAHGGTAG